MLLTTGSSVKDAKGNIYILDDVLGGGGFGNVFKAHRQSDGFVVAVKTLLSSFASPDVLLAFQKELQCTSVVSSDNVIKYYFTHDGTMYPEYPPYIIMEYIDGGTLNKLLQTQAATGKLFELSFITNACMQLAEGMNAISKTLVHRANERTGGGGRSTSGSEGLPACRSAADRSQEKRFLRQIFKPAA